MYNRILKPKLMKSRKSVLLLGARQVGKSTLLNSLKPDLTINLADEEEYFHFQGNNLELKSRIEAAKPGTIYIDEIQRIPRLLNTIQSLLDDQQNKLKFFLSGSSARKLKKGKANLLPGRLFTYQLGPLSLLELKEDWNEQKALQYGTLPGLYSLKSDSEKKKLLFSYAQTYLKEEIQAEALARSLDGFVRFLREAAASSGGFLDYSKIAQKAKIPRQSAVRHFEVLEDTLIAKKVENDPDLDPDQCDLVKHPRFYFFDIGVVNALRGGFEVTQDRVGAMWEYLVFNQLVNASYAFDINCDLYNFRTRGGLEVDFILSTEKKKFALECKASTSISPADYQNLLALERYYPRINKLVIYRGTKDRKENGVWIVPLSKALEILGFS